MHPFRAAVESGDLTAVQDLLSPDVVFTSPVVFKPYLGKAITAAILRAVTEVFEDVRYVREIGDADAADHALVFEARVGDRTITGCDFVHVGEDGLIDDLMVMVRPLSAAQALAAAMSAKFERIEREAQEAAGA